MPQEKLTEILVEHLRDIYDAEKQIVKALPKLAKAADSEELADALRKHLAETENQVTRLEQVFESMGVAAKGKPCKGMKGLLEEGDEAVQEHEEGSGRDLAIIAGCQKVEHYEISAYGTARTMAEQLEIADAVALLQETEDEEKQADDTLTDIVMSLYAAMETDSESEEEAETNEAPKRATAGTKRTPQAKRRSA